MQVFLLISILFLLFNRQPCPWDITLDRVLETEIELEEKTKLDHSFVSIGRLRKFYPLKIVFRFVFMRRLFIFLDSKKIFYVNLL
jgi:hypothetical protein